MSELQQQAAIAAQGALLQSLLGIVVENHHARLSGMRDEYLEIQRTLGQPGAPPLDAIGTEALAIQIRMLGNVL